MAQITINEGLAWLNTLKKRHEELLALRNDNAHRERRFYGASADKEIVKEPVYDVKVLDRLVTRVAREMRLLQAVKAANAKTTIDGYEHGGSLRGVRRCGSGSQPTLNIDETPAVWKTDPC
jgi:hypothetical protein